MRRQGLFLGRHPFPLFKRLSLCTQSLVFTPSHLCLPNSTQYPHAWVVRQRADGSHLLTVFCLLSISLLCLINPRCLIAEAVSLNSSLIILGCSCSLYLALHISVCPFSKGGHALVYLSFSPSNAVCFVLWEVPLFLYISTLYPYKI